MKFGCHVSYKGNFVESLKYARKLGMSAFQIFTGPSNKVDFSYTTVYEDMDDFRNLMFENNMSPVAHACLVSNLASSSPRTTNLSINILTKEMRRCELLGINYIVVHPGSNSNKQKGLDTLVNSINTMNEKLAEYNWGKGVMVLLETMVGSGNQLCADPSHFKYVLDRVGPNIGICLDTAHVFASSFSVEEYLKYFEENSILDRVKVVHFNNSKMERHSKKDRHEALSQGKITLEELKHYIELLGDNVIYIFENPMGSVEDDLQEIITFKELVGELGFSQDVSQVLLD